MLLLGLAHGAGTSSSCAEPAFPCCRLLSALPSTCASPLKHRSWEEERSALQSQIDALSSDLEAARAGGGGRGTRGGKAAAGRRTGGEAVGAGQAAAGGAGVPGGGPAVSGLRRLEVRSAGRPDEDGEDEDDVSSLREQLNEALEKEVLQLPRVKC
jgi:hypothetical protein